MIQSATPGRAPIFVCRSWLCCHLTNIFNLQNKKNCIHFYQRNITFKNIINLVSFIINFVEYSVTVLDNFRKRYLLQSKKHLLWRYSTASLSFWGIPPPPWSAFLDEGLMKVSLWQFELPHYFFFYHISTCKRALQLLHCYMALSIRLQWYGIFDSDKSWRVNFNWMNCSFTMVAF